MKLNQIENIVDAILIDVEEARGDDFILINEYYKKIGIYTDLLNFDYLIKHHIELGLPSFESITRARRKIQEKKPYLKANEAIRKEEERLFRNYGNEKVSSHFSR